HRGLSRDRPGGHTRGPVDTITIASAAARAKQPRATTADHDARAGTLGAVRRHRASATAEAIAADATSVAAVPTTTGTRTQPDAPVPSASVGGTASQLMTCGTSSSTVMAPST